ncbi:hypothetical protein TPA0907_44210 [Micromonospora humidisoli]|nr:hypothetical protein TPA0907_44210 [Micromonospora sp. AKA109]
MQGELGSQILGETGSHPQAQVEKWQCVQPGDRPGQVHRAPLRRCARQAGQQHRLGYGKDRLMDHDTPDLRHPSTGRHDHVEILAGYGTESVQLSTGMEADDRALRKPMQERLPSTTLRTPTDIPRPPATPRRPHTPQRPAAPGRPTTPRRPDSPRLTDLPQPVDTPRPPAQFPLDDRPPNPLPTPSRRQQLRVPKQPPRHSHHPAHHPTPPPPPVDNPHPPHATPCGQPPPFAPPPATPPAPPPRRSWSCGTSQKS